MTMDKGVMQMRPVTAAIERGKPFKATPVFEKAGPLEAEFSVRRRRDGTRRHREA
jgi:copper(I)-binding protein